jgi:hypothetical protein
MILSQNDVGITFLLGLSNTLQGCNLYATKPKRFFYKPKKGISHPLCDFGHKQYPSSSLD